MVAVTAGPSATRPSAPLVPEYNINTPDTTVPTAPPPPLPLQPRPPVSIHLGRLLNTGGQSSIYECTVNPHPSDLPPSLIAKVVTRTSQAQADAAFVAAQMVQNIPPHPNIAPYFQVTMDSSQLSVTALMPRYPGDLQSYVGRRRPHPLPPPTIIAVALQITKAIAHLHRHGVVHGDISLRNVVVDDMLSATPTVHLIDLEECIRVAAGETVTLPDSRFTEEFAAPERRNGHVSHQTDVFSTGVLLYELATRQPSEFPGLVSVPELGIGMLNMPSMTPTRLSYVVHRDVGDTNLASLITLMLHHDAKTRVPMEHVEALLQTLATSGTLGFPTCLKPIRASRVPLDVAQSVVQIHHDALQFDVISLCVHCNQLRHSPSNPKYRSDCTQNRIHLPGQLSPSASQQPKALGAMSPPGSVSYFMYPMATSMVEPGFEVVEIQGDPMKQLQLHGGFLAYHSDTHAVADLFVMSETSSGVLSRVSTSIVFSAAQPWPSECTVELQRQGRIHGPIPAFLGTETPGDAKAHQFAWLRPQEQFKLANGETWTPCEDGGFVFWFNENAMQPNPLDRMFAIAAPIGPVPAPPTPLLKSPRESPKLLASRAVNATLAAAGAAVQIASAATSVIFGRGDGSVSPPPIASARHDIVPVSLHGCSIALQLIEVAGQHFRVPSTGEEGDVGLANEISAAAAAAFKFPRQTVRIALLQVRHARGERLLPHHGLLGVDIRGVPTGVLALRVVVDNPGDLRSVSTAAPAGFRIPTIVPREGQRTERYTGNTEPLPLMTQAEDEARNAQQQPRFFGMEVQRELIRFFYVVDDACTVWHVRNLRV